MVGDTAVTTLPAICRQVVTAVSLSLGTLPCTTKHNVLGPMPLPRCGFASIIDPRHQKRCACRPRLASSAYPLSGHVPLCTNSLGNLFGPDIQRHIGPRVLVYILLHPARELR